MGVSSGLTRENTRLQQELCIAKCDIAARDAQLVVPGSSAPVLGSLVVTILPSSRPFELREELPEVGDSLERQLDEIEAVFDEEVTKGLGLSEGSMGGLVEQLVSVSVTREVIDLTNEDSDEEAEPENKALSLALANFENPEGDADPEEAVEPEEIDHPLSWGQRLSLATLEDSDDEPEEAVEEPEEALGLDSDEEFSEPEPEEPEDPDSESDDDVDPSESSEGEPGELEEAPIVRITRNKRSRDEG